MKHLAAYENVAVTCTTGGKMLVFGVLEQTKTLYIHEDCTIARALGTTLTAKNYAEWKKNRTNIFNKIEINY